MSDLEKRQIEQVDFFHNLKAKRSCIFPLDLILTMQLDNPGNYLKVAK